MFFLQLSFLNETENCPLAVRRYVYDLSEKEKIAQLFLVRVPGDTEFDYQSDSNSGIAPGGYIFFKMNLKENEEDIIHFTNSIKNYYDSLGKIKPYLSIDHEGGAVNRIRSVSPNFRSQQFVAQNYSKCEAQLLYFQQAEILKRLGFDVNLAPVVEVLTQDNQDFLVDRSFGNLNEVATYSSVCSDSYASKGIVPVLKHFPGNTNDDPHYGIPNLKVDEKGFSDLTKSFSKTLSASHFSKNADSVPFGILISHAIVGQYSDNLPSCLSEKIVTGQLKQNLNFSGLIFSDDVYMAALRKIASTEATCKMAILSGIDVIMMTGTKFTHLLPYLQQEEEKDPVLRKRINESCYKIVDAKRKLGYARIVKTENHLSFVFEAGGFPKMYDYSFVLVKE